MENREPSSEFGRQLLALYAQRLPPESTRPVYTCLREAFVGRIVELADLASVAPTTGSRARVPVLYKELKELRDWLAVPLQPDLKKAFPELVASMLSIGWPSSDIAEIVKPMRKPPRGRLPSKRLVAVEALELRIADSRRWSYGKLAQRFCHDSNRDNMKKLIDTAREVCRKYCPAFRLGMQS